MNPEVARNELLGALKVTLSRYVISDEERAVYVALRDYYGSDKVTTDELTRIAGLLKLKVEP